MAAGSGGADGQKPPLVAGNRGELGGDSAARGGVAEALRADCDTTRPGGEEIARMRARCDAAHADDGDADALTHAAELGERDRADRGPAHAAAAGAEPRLAAARIERHAPQR